MMTAFRMSFCALLLLPILAMNATALAQNSGQTRSSTPRSPNSPTAWNIDNANLQAAETYLPILCQVSHAANLAAN